MDIVSKPSPNFDARNAPLDMLVLHYTGMETGQAALERLCDAEAKVSAHYVVEEDGRIFQLLDEDVRGWHAGVAGWRGITDINSHSIGIEIVNGGHDFGLPDFPDVQIEKVMALCTDILSRHTIKSRDIIGHSDVAPARKQDPGEKFPWKHLAQNGIGYWPHIDSEDRRVLFEADERDRGVAVVQSGLGHIGYGIEVTGKLDAATRLVVAAFQRRYRPDQVDGIVDVMTLELIKDIAENV